MKLRKSLLAAAGAAGVAGVLALGGVAHAGVGPVQTSPKGPDSISGYYAHALNDGVNFTHITSYVGSNGHHTIEQLPVSTLSPVSINGAAGISLCNQQTGAAAQTGLVNAGGGLVDVVWSTGQFSTPNPNNDDQCQGGIVNSTGLNSGGERSGVLKTGIPDNDTVSLDILYDYAHAFTFRGHRFSAGTIVFSATDLGHPGVSYTASVLEFHHGLVFNEGDSAVADDTQQSSALPGTYPYPDGNANLLERFAHVALDGNRVNGGSEVFGSLQDSAAWTAFPVVATASGRDYLAPSQFLEDHFSEFVGAPVN